MPDDIEMIFVEVHFKTCSLEISQDMLSSADEIAAR